MWSGPCSGSDKLYKGAPEHCRPVSSLEAQRIPPGGFESSESREAESLEGPTRSAIDPPTGSNEMPSTAPELAREDVASVETLSQPDGEPSRQATVEPTLTPDHSSDAVGIPVPEADDELFSEGGYAYKRLNR